MEAKCREVLADSGRQARANIQYLDLWWQIDSALFCVCVASDFNYFLHSYPNSFELLGIFSSTITD